jgi:hypothetical protein
LSSGEKQQIYFVVQLTEQKSINYCWIQTERENTIVKSIPILLKFAEAMRVRKKIVERITKILTQKLYLYGGRC